MKKIMGLMLLGAVISVQAESRVPYCPEWLCGAVIQQQRCMQKHTNCPFCNPEKLTTPLIEDDKKQPFFVVKKTDGDGFLVILRDPCNDLRDCPADLKQKLFTKAEELADGRAHWILVNNGFLVGQSVEHLHLHVGFDLNPNQRSKRLAQELRERAEQKKQ